MNTSRWIGWVVGTLTCLLLNEIALAIPTVQRLPDNPNSVQGTCKDLRKAAVDGVKDSSGNVYKGACGYTQFMPYFDHLSFQTYVEEVALGNIKPITILPGQDKPGQKCLQAKGFNVELSGSAEVSYLDWQHHKPANSKCAKEWNGLKKTILDHEAKHVSDAKPVLSEAQKRLETMEISHCAESLTAAQEGLLEKALTELRETAISMKAHWEKLSSARDNEGDLCNINCCSCSDSTCYAGSFKASSSSAVAVSFSGGRGENIELNLIREDKDSQGRTLQQFYTIERGEFIYPEKVSMGEFDCKLDRTVFPLTKGEGDMSLLLNNPNFPKGSYNIGFSIVGNPTGTCYLRSNPKVVMTIPLYPFNFGLFTDCSTLSPVAIQNPSVLEGSFPFTCAGITTTLEWILKRND